MRRCIVAGASPEFFWDARWEPEAVICADGGAENALALGLKPDVVIGDRDSYGRADIALPAEKDMTDMEACIDYALQTGFEEIALLGASGGRLDHFLGNIGLLERAGERAFILDRNHEIRMANGRPYTVGPPHRYRYFSVVPLDETVTGVTVTGAKYTLDHAALRRAATVGVSNEPLPGQSLAVSVKNGKALLIFCEKV